MYVQRGLNLRNNFDALQNNTNNRCVFIFYEPRLCCVRKLSATATQQAAQTTLGWMLLASAKAGSPTGCLSEIMNRPLPRTTEIWDLATKDGTEICT
mmetsp:Transcript_5694/g.11287  ORF Transcript_5694/g.11287 Transcript_5694/m.11287 type:complete len:97 (-) Transcript_5694:679-969(-)